MCVVEIPKGSRNKYEYDAEPGAIKLHDPPKQLAAEIGHFFAVYEDLDYNRGSTVCGWRESEAELLEIEESRRRYREHNSIESTAIGAQ